jgi:hypothetical protein
MSAFEDFIQVELPRRPWVIDAGAEETVLVRRGAGPRQSVWVGLSEGQVLGKVGGLVQGVTIEGLGGNVIPKHYIFTQVVATKPWIITHSMGSTDVSIQVFDEANRVIIPEDIAITDSNVVTISFSANQAGKAILIFAS